MANIDKSEKEVEKLLKDLNVYFSDGNNDPRQFKEWLHNRYSGYPDLVEKLLEIIPSQQIGEAVPLDNINGKYGYSLTHNKKKLKAAFIEAWREKNNI
jgi:predicted MPP superfamily phosphohydrolase